MKNYTQYHLIFLLLILTGISSSCKKDKPKIISMGYDFFPVEEGHYVLYEVMEVRHDTDLIPVRDTSLYFIKEVIGELIIDEQGDTAHKLYRFKGPHPDSLYIQDVWTIKRTNTNAQKVEENIRFVKLAFATTLDKEWNGNALNNLDAQTYSYDWVDASYTMNTTFPSTVKVLQNNFYTFVDYLNAYEIYARDIGMIKKVEKNFFINDFDTINVLRGNELLMEAIEIGKE